MRDLKYDNNKVCAIIVTFNGAGCILNTIKALVGQVAKIVIYDNGSNIETVNILREQESKSISVIYGKTNAGVAHALNQGVLFAIQHKYDWVLTMDQDSIADPFMVGNLLECARYHADKNDVVSFSPVIKCEGHAQKLKENITYEDRYTVITSGNLLNIRVFEQIGFFDEKLFIDSVDFEYCLRLKMHGYRILRCYKAVLCHSLGSVYNFQLLNFKMPYIMHAPFRKYYIMRNHIYITAKYISRFPVYCMWKQVAILRLLIQIAFIEKDKFESIRYVFKGLCDGVLNKYGAMLNKQQL